MISAFTDVIQDSIQPAKITVWLKYCSDCFVAWNQKKASRVSQEANQGNKRRSEELESGEVEKNEPSPPPKKTKKKTLVPDDNPEF